jgi:hypothetical protein
MHRVPWKQATRPSANSEFPGAQKRSKTSSDREEGPQVLADKDDWQKAFWFGSVNTYLSNKMPKELLKSKPQEVLRAAEIEAKPERQRY